MAVPSAAAVCWGASVGPCWCCVRACPDPLAVLPCSDCSGTDKEGGGAPCTSPGADTEELGVVPKVAALPAFLDAGLWLVLSSCTSCTAAVKGDEEGVWGAGGMDARPMHGSPVDGLSGASCGWPATPWDRGQLVLGAVGQSSPPASPAPPPPSWGGLLVKLWRLLLLPRGLEKGERVWACCLLWCSTCECKLVLFGSTWCKQWLVLRLEMAAAVAASAAAEGGGASPSSGHTKLSMLVAEASMQAGSSPWPAGQPPCVAACPPTA
mmetsp:Transcript_2665/g.6842  ORF Transcript_2665/g.6842 Transcript_2665/m.6842 type:complete len:266 (+) Transcript_2665:1086-1883(+)|eukprot:1143207-Pelagomonas_calceolata.AAC.7